MQEAEAKLVWNTFSSVMPYLVYPQELRGILERSLGESADIEAFVAGLRQIISKEVDATKKTDGQIFINELRRRSKK